MLEIKEQNLGLCISLNRPEKHNALNGQMVSDLKKVLAKAGSLSQLRYVLLSGHGKNFCAGADLEWMKSMVNYSVEENRKEAQELFAMFESIRDCPLPVLAQIQGKVMGGGVGLVAACDVVLAENGAEFCFSEVRLGLVPAVISPFVLMKTGAAFARRYMMTGEIFGVQEALAAQLIQFVGAEKDVSRQLGHLVECYKNAGPEAVRETKRLLNFNSKNSWEAIRSETARVIAERRVSAEGQDGLKSFLTKSEPSWRRS